MEGKLFDSERKVMEVLWKEGDMTAGQLAKRLLEEAGWNRNTTYTVIKRLSDRGVVKNENATVTALVSKEEVQLSQMEEMMEKTFEGSLPAFLAAFARRQALSKEEEEEIRRIIEK